MGESQVFADYEAVRPARRLEPRAGGAAVPAEAEPDAPAARREWRKKKAAAEKLPAENWVARRGHFVTYVGLLLFTFFVFFRPYELYDVPLLDYGAQVLAVLTLLAYFPSQLAAEGNLTARPREVVFALLLLLTALLSVPTAISPGEAWENFVEFLKVILIFVVAVNVVRTERRLRALILIPLAVSVMLSFNAFSDYRSGHLALKGVRIKGALGGLFDNPNDLALHLVTMIPLAVGFALSRRGALRKVSYGLCAALFTAGVVATFSRAGFLGLLAAAGVLAWKYGRKHRLTVAVLMVLTLGVFVATTPGEYGSRITSMFTGDATGSADARRDLFWRSALVALRYPITGVGIGNFYYKGAHDHVSHNAYTQVAAEMGMAALAFYVLFMVTPLRRLRRVERESSADRERANFYHLAVGLQASLVAYMVTSFFASVAHLWYVYYLVAYAVCLRRLYALKYGADAEPAAATTPAAVAPTL